MLALCSQENLPSPLSIPLHSEGLKNPVRIPWPEFSVTAPGLMMHSSLRGSESVSGTFTPELGQ